MPASSRGRGHGPAPPAEPQAGGGGVGPLTDGTRRRAHAAARRRPPPRTPRVGAGRRCRPAAAARLRIDEPELADVRQLLLARVADLDRDHVGGRRARAAAPPVERAAEVGDDGDEGALAAAAADRGQRLGERGRAGLGGLGLLAQRGQQTAGRIGPAAAAAIRGSAPPKVTMPSRLPRRVPTWPTASARPRRRPPCAGRRCRTSSTATCRARATSSARARPGRPARAAHARRHVPVDPAHVVARLVRPHLRELAADPELAER